MRGRRFRPFRFGLVLGVVGAVVWFLQRQRAAEVTAPAAPAAPAAPVAPAPRTAPASPPVVRRPPPEPAPAPPPLPIAEPEVLEVGDLDRPGEPEVETVEPAPQPAVAPVAKKVPPLKKAAPKKATAKKAPAKKAAPATKAAAKKAPDAPVTWVAPEGGLCPTTHPVKAKLASRLFHLPGMFAYARTNPDRCYRDAESAEADGLRPAKR